MTVDDAPSLPGDDAPHDPARSEAQVDGLLRLLGAPPRCVLELGCGGGRVLVPLAACGHRVTGIDRDPEALQRCRQNLRPHAESAQLIHADFLSPWPVAGEAFDAVLCLGNTFMTICNVHDAVLVLRQAAGVLRSGGAFIIDDFPHDLWPELTEGNWLNGVSDDGRLQMLWTCGDTTFALREGDAVDPSDDSPRPDDRLFRLWSMGELTLAVLSAGLSAPRRAPEAGLLIMQSE